MKKIMNSIILSMFFLSFSFAYSVGDKIDQTISEELSLQSDKIYVINFFASWCKSCKYELPLINKLSNKISLVGVNVDRDHKVGKQFVNNIKLDFPIVYDSKSKIIKAFDPIGVPAIYFIKDHHVIAQKIGAIDNIDSYIIKVLEELK